jgi:hypothetical protein
MTRRQRPLQDPYRDDLALGIGTFGATGWTPIPVPVPTHAATTSKVRAGLLHVRRAHELDRQGTMTRRQIGEKMAEEDGRPERPYEERQIRTWLSKNPDVP